MDGMQERIDNNSGRLDVVEVEQQTLRAAVSYTQSELDKTNDKLSTVEATANEALNKAEVGIRDADQAKDIAIQADNKAQQALDHNITQDKELARLDDVKADKSDLANVDNKATDALNAVENALHQNSVQDAQITDLQATKADRSELEDVAIKADGALAGAIENRNQIDAVKEDLANTDKQVIKNKNDIADLKNQNGVLNNAVANAQDTANTASAKADKAQNTADKAVAGVNSVKNDVKVVSRDVANNSIRIQRNEERIDGAYAGIYDNRKNIEANRQAQLAAQRAHEQKMAKIAAAQRAKQAAAQAAARQAKENERLADKARDQGYEDELRALAIEEKRMELAHKKAMLEAQSKAADKYVEQDLNVRKAATDVIQSQADANRNITKGIQNNLESQGKAEEKRAGNWFNR